MRGSTSKIISRWDRSHGLASRGSLTGGERRPTKLFKSLESHLDAPADAVELQDVLGRKRFFGKRSDENDPLTRCQRSCGNVPALFSRRQPSLSSCFCRSRSGFTQCDKPHRQWGDTFIASEPYRPIDLARASRFQHGKQIKWLAISVQPARMTPTGPHQHIGALRHDSANLIDLQKASIADAYLASYHWNAIDALAAGLIRQFQKVKPFAGHFKARMDAP